MKIDIGALFSVPIANGGEGYGQVVDRFEKILLYCVFFSTPLANGIKTEPENILLAGITASAKLNNGDWKLVGKDIVNLTQIKRPYFKVMIDGQMQLESFSGKTVRRLKVEECDILPFRSITAPIRYEKALNAHFGLGEWMEPYDKLLYEKVLLSHEIAG